LVEKILQVTPEVHTAYVPIWWPQNKVSNVAKGIKSSLDAEPLFSHGGFGDLAMEDAEASAEYSKKFTSNIQHFDMVTVFHTPDTSNIQRMILEAPPFNIVNIKCPFTLIIYDDKKKMPVYYGRILRPKVVDPKTSNVGENDEHKRQPKKWCKLM
ncbi:hypothetical protein Angca_001901, partial [Angiostrongylus cantonensis]